MIIYMVVYFLIGLISLFVDKIIKMTITPFVSGLLGSLLGVLKGLVLCGVVLSATTAFVRPDQAFFTESSTWPYLQPMCSWVKEWTPTRLKELMSPQMASRALKATSDPKSGQTIAPPTDFQSLKKVLADRSELISEGWKEKFGRLSGPEALDPEDLKRFIRDHPNLFAHAPAITPQPPSSPTPLQPSPSWPSPAVD
jgi:hypothetical protein